MSFPCLRPLKGDRAYYMHFWPMIICSSLQISISLWLVKKSNTTIKPNAAHLLVEKKKWWNLSRVIQKEIWSVNLLVINPTWYSVETLPPIVEVTNFQFESFPYFIIGVGAWACVCQTVAPDTTLHYSWKISERYTFLSHQNTTWAVYYIVGEGCVHQSFLWNFVG